MPTRSLIRLCALLAVLTCFPQPARSQHIPKTAYQHRADLIRTARAVWGLNAPVAVFAAQIHTESRWNARAVSYAGAQGLAQFMPATAAWLPQAIPETGHPAPFNPAWALRGLVSYDRWLWQRVEGANPFERIAFTLSAYNGGLGWVRRDKRLAHAQQLNPQRWFEHVARVNAGRRASAFQENRAYVRLILQQRQQLYQRAGWGQGIAPSTMLSNSIHQKSSLNQKNIHKEHLSPNQRPSAFQEKNRERRNAIHGDTP